MKTLLNVLNEDSVEESFLDKIFVKYGSSTIRRLFMFKRRQLDSVINKFYFDKITDDDIYQLDPKSAVEEAEKPNTHTLFLWVMSSSKTRDLIAISENDSVIWFSDSILHNGMRPTIRFISRRCTMVYCISQSDRFETKDLIKEKSIAKNNYDSLMNNQKITDTNLSNYQKIKSQINNSGDSAGMLYNNIQDSMDTYRDSMRSIIAILASVILNPAFNDEMEPILDQFRNLQNSVRDFLNTIRHYTYSGSYYSHSNEDTDNIYRKSDDIRRQSLKLKEETAEYTEYEEVN